MRKYFWALLLAIGSFSACEKDDFCTQTPVTPNLVIRFYDKEAITETKAVSRLSVIAQSKTDSLIISQTIDSIAIPLNGAAFETVYTLKMNDVDGKVADNKTATLTINYVPEEDYISRSCGFRYIFKNVTLSYTNPSWIDSLSTTTITEINNQFKAHVQVFH